MKIQILKGLPASGKSTYAKKFCEDNPDWVRVSRDDLRNMRGRYWLPKDENFITALERDSIKNAIKCNKNVIVDATNLNPMFFDELKEYCKELVGNNVIIKDNFCTDPWQCVKWDLKRKDSVGRDVIMRMFYKYVNKDEKYQHNVNKPRAVIFDIDGTLAEMSSGRSPYDWYRVSEDTVIEPVKNMLMLLHNAGTKIIIFTGRDGECELITRDWLRMNGIPYDYLGIRPAGDSRKDYIVKGEMFDRIKNDYNITAVFDDRPQMVDYWKSRGLHVFNCNQSHLSEF